MSTRTYEPTTLLAAALLAGTSAVLASCSKSLAATAGPETTESRTKAPGSSADELLRPESLPEDAPLAERRRELLELAFDAATAMPLEPHVKNRARSQAEVVNACLELDQPRLALAFLEQIPNWRRGLAYADLAHWCADRGVDTPVDPCLERAAEIADAQMLDEEGQVWRRDRIRARIAATCTILGREGAAQALAADIVDSEAGAVQAVEARFIDERAFEDRIAALEHAAKVGSYEHMQNALQACVPLYERFYDDAARRERVDTVIHASWEKLPVELRIETLSELARVEIEHGQGGRALELVAEARAFLTSVDWMPEDHVRLLASLAELTFLAGDQEKARSEASSALAIYAEGRGQIVDMFRARALRPLAEAFLAMGDEQTALAIYARAVDEGVLNPNSRPRAQDLVSTTCSMALNGARPGDELWSRMREVRAAFGDPW